MEMEQDRLMAVYENCGLKGDEASASFADYTPGSEYLTFARPFIEQGCVDADNHLYYGLFLYGNEGVGKTYLAGACLNESFAQGRPGLFYGVIALLNDLKATFDPDNQVRFYDLMQRIIQAPLLVLDDWGTENRSTWAEEQLYFIMDNRVKLKLPLIITSNLSLEVMHNTCGDNWQKRRLLSRLRAMLKPVFIDNPDLRLPFIDDEIETKPEMVDEVWAEHMEEIG